MNWLLIFLFGGIGALLRFLFSAQLNSAAFPLGTLLVNVCGSFLIGFLVYHPHIAWSPSAKLAVLTGFLGALTTFSTYSLELVSMMSEGRFSVALLYFLLSQSVAISFCALGLRLARG